MHDDGDTITYIGATLHGHHSCIVDAETLDECIAKLRRLFEMALKHELNTLLNPFRVCVTKNISFPEFPDNWIWLILGKKIGYGYEKHGLMTKKMF